MKKWCFGRRHDDILSEQLLKVYILRVAEKLNGNRAVDSDPMDRLRDLDISTHLRRILWRHHRLVLKSI